MLTIILSLLCNLCIVCWTVIAVRQTARRSGSETGNPAVAFRYFTTDSNLLAGIAALAVAVCDVRLLLSGDALLPVWAALAKYIGTVAVMVTFLTVVVFLGPTMGYAELFAADGLFLHLIGPLLAALSFCLLDPGAALSRVHAVLGVLPTLLYGVLYLVMVVFLGKGNGGWEDFYGFNKDGKWPISMALMLAGTGGLSALLLFLHNAAR